VAFPGARLPLSDFDTDNVSFVLYQQQQQQQQQQPTRRATMSRNADGSATNEDLGAGRARST
jgi:hypothetical protein